MTSRDTRALAAVMIIAAALRFYPIWFGLPYPHARPDEETAIGHAIAVLRGDPNPHFFHWPSLTFYVLAGVFQAAASLRPALVADAEAHGIPLTLIARGVMALAGTLTVFVLYRLGRRIGGERVGVLAALLLAVAILHVRESHFAMTDVLLTFFTTVALSLLVRGIDEAEPRAFAMAGLAGGLAASTKYSAAAIFAPLAVAQLQLAIATGARRWRSWLPAVVFTIAFAGAFVAGTPYAVLDFPQFRADLVFDFTHLAGGHAGVDLGRGWTYHLTRSLPFGTGLTVFVAALAGVMIAARHHGRGTIVLATFFAGLYVALGSGTTVFFRYILPLVPIVCLLAAVAVHHGAAWLAARTARREGAWLALLLALTAGPGLVSCVWMDVLLARTDTRVLAARWFAERVRPEDTVYDAGGGYTRLDLGSLPYHDWRFDPRADAFAGADGRLPDWLVLHASPVRAYTWAPATLRSLAATRYRLVHTVNGPRRTFPGRAFLPGPLYDYQDAFFLPIRGFYTVERPGPTVQFYRRADLPD